MKGPNLPNRKRHLNMCARAVGYQRSSSVHLDICIALCATWTCQPSPCLDCHFIQAVKECKDTFAHRKAACLIIGARVTARDLHMRGILGSNVDLSLLNIRSVRSN